MDSRAIGARRLEAMSRLLLHSMSYLRYLLLMIAMIHVAQAQVSVSLRPSLPTGQPIGEAPGLL